MKGNDGKTAIMAGIADALGKHSDNPQVLALAAIGVGGVLYRHERREGGWKTLYDDNMALIGHIFDWLESAVADGDEWLSRTDDRGRPLKLLKMHSLEQLGREADKSIAKKVQKMGGATLLPEDETVHMELPDGYRIVRMLSPRALDRESAVMQHCVGMGSYDRHLATTRFGLFSLRDRMNKPHATLEVDLERKELLQLRGKQNAMPLMRYLKLLSPFVQTEGLESEEVTSTGFVFGRDGIVHHVFELPDGVTLPGSVALTLDAWDSDVRIPTGLTVEGNLIVSAAFAGFLDTDLVVGGDLVVHQSEGVTLSPLARIGGSIVFGACRDVMLPADLHVRGNLGLQQCTAVLPDGLRVDGDLDISGSGIENLPRNLSVGGNLVATDSGLLELPDGLSVGGSLMIGKTMIDTVPPGTSVGGNLLARDLGALRVEAGTRIGGFVSVDADMVHNLSIDGDADIDGHIHLRPSAGGPRGRTVITVDEAMAGAWRQALPAASAARL